MTEKKHTPLAHIVEVAAIVVALRFILNLLWPAVDMFPEFRIGDDIISTLIFIAALMIYFLAGWKTTQHKIGISDAAKTGGITGLFVSIAVHTVRRNGFLLHNLDYMDFAFSTAKEMLIGAFVVALGAWIASVVMKEEDDKKRAEF